MPLSNIKFRYRFAYSFRHWENGTKVEERIFNQSQNLTWCTSKQPRRNQVISLKLSEKIKKVFFLPLTQSDIVGQKKKKKTEMKFFYFGLEKLKTECPHFLFDAVFL